MLQKPTLCDARIQKIWETKDRCYTKREGKNIRSHKRGCSLAQRPKKKKKAETPYRENEDSDLQAFQESGLEIESKTLQGKSDNPDFKRDWQSVPATRQGHSITNLLFHFVFVDSLSLGSPDCPGTHRGPPASVI